MDEAEPIALEALHDEALSTEEPHADLLLEGDVDRFKEFTARFSDPVYPGDTLTTQGWRVDGGYIIQVKAEERAVLTNAMVVVEGM